MAIDVAQRLADFAALDDAGKLAMLESLSEDEARAMLESVYDDLPLDAQQEAVIATQRLSRDWAPHTDDELWQFYLSETGLRIPRRHVCEGHCAPIDFFADLYFERGNPDKIAIADRGGGKTSGMAGLHWINGRTKPKHEGVSAGAVKDQAAKCYRYFKTTAKAHAELLERPPMQGATDLKNGSRVEIVTGTISGVNSPHPNLAHLDEIELLRPGVYEEALNMAQSSQGWAAQNALTSTWKKVKGLVTKLVAEVRDAERAGQAAAYQIYTWCIWETTERCEASCFQCPFAEVVKGKWEDGSPRTFESACKRGSPVVGQGKLKFSDGFRRIDDAVSAFKKLSKRMWEAQRESRRPSPEGLIYAMFDEDEHGVWNWDPRPELGEVFVSVDFGATGGTSIGLWQRLDHSVQWDSRVIPDGAVVRFDELFMEGKSATAAGVELNTRLNEWEERLPGFRANVNSVYRDVAALQPALDWIDLPMRAPGDPAFQSITAVGMKVPLEDGIKEVQSRIEDGKFYVDVRRCEHWLEERDGYERDDNGKPVKEDDHAMDETRYLVWNLHVRSRGGGVAQTTNVPTAVESRQPRAVSRESDGGILEWHMGALAANERELDLDVAVAKPRPPRGIGMGGM